MLRLAAAAAMLLALNTGAQAQIKPHAEKISPRPVQPAPSRGAFAPPGEFVYSPWTKFCGRDTGNPQAQTICLTVKEARLPTGQFIAGAALVEQDGAEQKTFRATLPVDVERATGARVFIDDDPARRGGYATCLPNGCIADFAIDAAFIARLKAGQFLYLEGVISGAAVTYRLPLGDFEQANEGPPSDPQRFEEKRRWDERSRIRPEQK